MQCYDVIVIITVKFQLINLQVKFSEGKHAYTLTKDLKCKYFTMQLIKLKSCCGFNISQKHLLSNIQ